MAIKKYQSICILFLLFLFDGIIQADNYYSSEPYPEYESLLNTDPLTLITTVNEKLNDPTLSLSTSETLNLLLLRLQANIGLGETSIANADGNEALKLALAFSDAGIISNFYQTQSYLLKSEGKFTEAFEKLSIAMDYALLSEDNRIIALALLTRGSLNHSISDFEQALSDFIKVYDIAEKYHDTELLNNVLNSIALVYDSSGNYTKAIEYHKKILNTLDFNTQFYGVSIIYYNLASSYEHVGNLDEALTYYIKSKEFAKKIDDSIGIAYAESRLGNIALRQKNFNEAESYFLRSLEILESSNQQAQVFSVQLSLADLYIKQHMPEEAKSRLENAKKFIVKELVPKNEARWLKVRTSLAELNKDFEAAYEFFQQYVEKNQKTEELHKEKSLQLLQVKFSSKIKEDENHILKAQAQLQQLNLEKTEALNNINNMIIGFILIVIIFMSYHFYRQFKSKKILETLALTDELTGVSNRRHIMQLLTEEIYRANRLQSSLNIAIIDLDFFKKINDSYGHIVGDTILKTFSSRVKSEIREYDNIGRIGGEEWLLLFPHVNNECLDIIIQRIRENIKEIPITEDGQTISVTFSMGITTLREGDRTAQDLITRADNALYKAKSKGRNCHCYDDTK